MLNPSFGNERSIKQQQTLKDRAALSEPTGWTGWTLLTNNIKENQEEGY